MQDYHAIRLPVLEARVDWITCSAKRTEDGIALHQFAYERIGSEHNHGDKIEPYYFKGYSGHQTNHWHVGAGPNGYLVAVGGQEAQRWAPYLAQIADHWSRVDYAVTVQDTSGQVDPSEDYWAQWPWNDRPLRAMADLARIQHKQRGNTITIGQRTAAVFVRVYDKSVESPQTYPPGCWRWEVELKRHVSEGQQARWREGKIPPTYALDYIAHHMATYRLPVPWDRETEVETDRQLKPPRDADRILRWLERQVRPSVDFAVERRGAEAVLRALNLPHVHYGEVNE